MKASDNVFPKIIASEGAAPATPASGTVVIYAKADGLLYAKDDAGTETALGGGSATFIGLTDVPANYTGAAGLYAKVNAGETGLEFDAPTGSGDVTGPASSTDGNLAVFDGATGKLLKDGGAPLTNPMTTAGDIITGGTSGAVQRLGIGSEDQVLKIVSGAVAWADEAGGGGGSDVLDVSSPSNASGTVTLDFGSKSRYAGAITLGANVTTLAFSNLPCAGKFAEYELHITQDGTGSRTFAIPASHKALGGSDTAIASAANAVTVLTASTVDNGTTWRYAMQESA